MKNKNKQKTITHRLNGTAFMINEQGFVSTQTCGQIGHLEDCIALAQTFTEVFAIGDEIHSI